MREKMARFAKYMELKGLNDNRVTVECGLGKGIFDQARKGKSDLGNKTIAKILAVYGDINRVWLLTGEGEMLKDDNDTSSTKKSASPLHVIKYYPNVDGAMGGVQFLDNPDETVIEMSIPGYTDCKFAINAYGESMSPLIKSGQIVLLAEWRERFIDWGKIYLIVTKSGYRVIKRLFPGVTSETIVCRSENKVASPDFEINVDDILYIFLVKGWVCRDVI